MALLGWSAWGHWVQEHCPGVSNRDRVLFCSGALRGWDESPHAFGDGCSLLLNLGSGEGEMTPGRSGEGLCAPQHRIGSLNLIITAPSPPPSLLRGAMKRTPNQHAHLRTGPPSPLYLGSLGPARGSSPHPVKSSLGWLPPTPPRFTQIPPPP